MYVAPINSNYRNNNSKTLPCFQSLIKDRSAMPVIKKLSESDTFIFNELEKRLSNTKFWDLKISSIGNKFEEFKFSFINKLNSNNIITDGIYPYDRKGNTIKFYSIVYGPKNTIFNTVETLKFKSTKRAAELYDSHKKEVQYLVDRNYNVSPVENLKIKEIELNMLEEAIRLEEEHSSSKHLITESQTKTTVGNKYINTNKKK